MPNTGDIVLSQFNGTHWVEFPVAGPPAAGQFLKALTGDTAGWDAGGGTNNSFNINLGGISLTPSAAVMTSTGASVTISVAGNYTMSASINAANNNAGTPQDAAEIAVSKDGISFIYLGGSQISYLSEQVVISGTGNSIACAQGDVWTLYVGSVLGAITFIGSDQEFSLDSLYFSGFKQA